MRQQGAALPRNHKHLAWEEGHLNCELEYSEFGASSAGP